MIEGKCCICGTVKNCGPFLEKVFTESFSKETFFSFPTQEKESSKSKDKGIIFRFFIFLP